MNRDRDGRPSKRRPETSKLSVTVRGSFKVAITLRSWLYLLAGSLVLCAAVLSLSGSGFATPVSYIGVAIGLFANAIPRQWPITVRVVTRVEWLSWTMVVGSIIIDVSTEKDDSNKSRD